MASPSGGDRTGQRPADVFVVFGIMGDLAKVMTFRSLYRLERRELLTCPDRRGGVCCGAALIWSLRAG